MIAVEQRRATRDLGVALCHPGPVAEDVEGGGPEGEAVALGGGGRGAFEDTDGEAVAPAFEGREDAPYACADDEDGGVVWG